MKKTYPLLAIILLLFTSCVENVDLKGKVDTDPKMVVNCMISPELDSVVLLLTQSVPIFGGGERSILQHATVEISHNQQQWHRLNYNASIQHYVITHEEFPIEHGKTYYLRASASGFDDISASCKVPYFRERVLSSKALSRRKVEGDSFMPTYYIHNFRIEWMDYPGEENYYYYLSSYSYHYYYDEYGWEVDTIPQFADISSMSNSCISDKERDGQMLSFEVSIMSFDEVVPELNPGEDLFNIQLDKHLYHYQISRSDGDYDFFMIEPSGTYTNVKNGYGVFGAFAMRKFEKH